MAARRRRWPRVQRGSRRRSRKFRRCSRSPGDPAAARAFISHNGARAAAAEILSTVLPAADVAMAQSVVTPDLWARAHRLGATQALDAISIVVGDAPSAQKERDALLAQLVSEGALISAPARRRAPAAQRVDTFLSAVESAWCAARDGDRDRSRPAPQVPGLDPRCHRRCVRDVVPGVGAVLRLDGRAVARQRVADRNAASRSARSPTALVVWLSRESDLFDALRRFAHSKATASARSARSCGCQRTDGGEREKRDVLAGIAAGRPAHRAAHGARRRDERVQRRVYHVLGPLAAARRAALAAVEEAPSTLAKFDALLADLDALGSVQAMILSGMGEPLIHPDIYAMIARVKRAGWHLTLMTNLIAADIDQLERAGRRPVSRRRARRDRRSRTRRSTPAGTSASSTRCARHLRRALDDAAPRSPRPGDQPRHRARVRRDGALRRAVQGRAGQLQAREPVRRHRDAAGSREEQRAWLLEDAVPRARALARPSSASRRTSTCSRTARRRHRGRSRDGADRGRRLLHGLRLHAHHGVELDVLYCCNTEVRVGSLADARFASCGTARRGRRCAIACAAATTSRAARAAASSSRTSTWSKRVRDGARRGGVARRNRCGPRAREHLPRARMTRRRRSSGRSPARATTTARTASSASNTAAAARSATSSSARIDAFAALPGRWEIKCSGGEAFAHPLFMSSSCPS